MPTAPAAEHPLSVPDRASKPLPASAEADALAAFLAERAPVFALTGAGMSTASGIPDYRDRDGRFKHAEPIRFQAFLHDPAARRRYWARSLAGWPRVAAALPNPGHRALAELERLGLVRQVVTQNVDGLHQRAGSRRVLDLHGRLDRVECLDCGLALPRARMQALLSEANPSHATLAGAPRPDGDTAPAAPDGDARLEPAADFRVPNCPRCGGLLKPAVVFFGENVPRPRVAHAFERLETSRGLLVLGSSLTVYSGYRFCVRAAECGLPIAILNLGRTRGDSLAGLKLDAECTQVLSAVAEIVSWGLPILQAPGR